MVPRSLNLIAIFAASLSLLGETFADSVDTLQQQRDLQDESTTTWPSLLFHFTLKRSSMNVYGQPNFDMYANPVVSEDQDSVLYDVFTTFTEDSMEHNYTVIDGSAYLATRSSTASVACLDSESDKLPPINTIVNAINEATAVSSASGSGSGAVQCSSGNLFKVSVNGIAFALCASALSGFKMTGSAMDITVNYLDYRVEMMNIGTTLECEAVASASSLTPVGRSLLTGDSALVEVERNLESEFDVTFWDDDDDSSERSSSSHDGSCSCKSTMRPCLFIHGMGVDREEPDTVDSFSYYWGNLTDHAPCCSSMKYTILNTVDNAWTNDTLQHQVCDRAVSVSKRSSKTVIADTIIITHSMANLMVGGAIATGKCKLDSSSTWVGLAGPMQGSMASDFVQETCAGETNFVLEKVANITGRCPPTVALKSLPSQGGNFSSAELNAAYTAAQKAYTSNVSALMCTAGYSGLASKYQAEFWVLGREVPYKSGKNDGMVEFESCAAGFPESKFGDTWRSPFYKTKLNHYDSEFLYGDALLDEKKMPIKWFECLL